MYHVHCSSPVIIENPSIRHEIKFVDTLVYPDVTELDAFMNPVIKFKRITVDEKFQVLSSLPLCRIFNVLPPKSIVDSYNKRFDYANQFYFLDSETGSRVDFFKEVPCGHCELCRDDYVSSLRQRVMFAIQETSYYPFFVTLTYDKDLTPRRGPDIKRFQLFKKKLKKTIHDNYNYDSSLIKFVAVSENGHDENGKDNDNLHIHCLIIGLPMLHPNQKTNFLITEHILEYCWRLPEYTFDKNGKQSLNPISWTDYRKKYSLITKRPKGYDPYSFGYVHLKQVDSPSKVINYICKYITKDLHNPEKVHLLKEVDPVYQRKLWKFGQIIGENHYFYYKPKYDKRGWRPHFLSLSTNLGLKFLSSLIVNSDGRVQFCNWLDQTLYTVHLCGYYLNKLFPTFNTLVPPYVRKCYDNCLIEISRCLGSRFITKPIRKMLLGNSVYVRNNFSWLGEFDVPHDSFDFPDEHSFDDSLSSIAHYTSVLYAFLTEFDIEEIRKRVLLRDAYMTLFIGNSINIAPSPADSVKIRKQYATMRSKSYV